MKQNNHCYLFGMYEPNTDSVIVNAINNTYTGTPLTISCEKCNSAVLLNTPDDILVMADAYIKVIFAGIFCTMSYNVASGLLRSIGDSKTPLYFLICLLYTSPSPRDCS